MVTNNIFKRAFKNSFYLVLAQGSNFLLPLVVSPYLLRIVGSENFGQISLAFTLMVFITVFVDYGVQVWGVRLASLNASDNKKLGEILINITALKIFLTSLCFIGLNLSFVFWIDNTTKALLFLLSFPLVIGQSFFPVWFFQALEKMQHITIFNLLSKLVATLLILLLINTPDDYIYVNLLQSSGNIIAIAASYFLIIYKLGIPIKRPNIQIIRSYIKEGKVDLSSAMLINVFMNANILAVGAFCNDLCVGSFSIADKLLALLKQGLGVIFNATYPILCKADLLKRKLLMKWMNIAFISIFSILGTSFYLFADEIVYLFSGSSNPMASELLKILAFAPLITSMNITSYQSLLIHKQKKRYFTVIAFGAAIWVIQAIIFGNSYQAYGIAYTILFTELMITVGMIIQLRRWKESTI